MHKIHECLLVNELDVDLLLLCVLGHVLKSEIECVRAQEEKVVKKCAHFGHLLIAEDFFAIDIDREVFCGLHEFGYR